jgi:preprotein translocase subunit SecY
VPHLLAAAKEFDPAAQIVLCAGAADTPELGAEVQTATEALRASRTGVFWISEMLPFDQLRQLLSHATVFICLIQAYFIVRFIMMPMGAGGQGLASQGFDGTWFWITQVLVLTAGTVFLMWLGEQITARGVGNGISLIIFAGIVAELPRWIFNTFASLREGQMEIISLLAIIAMAVAMVIFIVFIERSQRRLLIQYPKRQQGNRMVGGESSFLPLKVNSAGVIPPIFASSLLLLPATMAGFANAQGGQGSGWWAETLQIIQAYLGHGQPGFIVLYAVLIIFFCFFYTAIVFNPEETAENLRKYGGFIPGYRPGKRTAEHLDYVLTRLTVIGSIYIAFVCVIPELIRSPQLFGTLSSQIYIGGTSILIVVSVTMDTVAQIQSHLIGHQYEGMIKRSRLGGKKK